MTMDQDQVESEIRSESVTFLLDMIELVENELDMDTDDATDFVRSIVREEI